MAGQKPQKLKVLIVGAGPTGLTAALELARYGVLPEVVDKKIAPSSLSRAVGIMPCSIDKLRPTGVGDAILQEGIRLRKIMLHRNQQKLLWLDFSDISKDEDTIVGLAQDRTEVLMSEGLERLGGKVQYDCEVVDVVNQSDHVRVIFSTGQSAEYDWVIAAEGVHSMIRERLGIAFEGHDLPEQWSIADIDIRDTYEPGLFSAWLQDDGRPTIIVPIEKQRVRVVSATPDALSMLPPSVLSGIEVINVRRSMPFTISIRQAESYRKGRVLLAGDAAHSHSPVGGRGMNLGIDDAVAAAQAILQGTVDDYSAARHAIGARVIRGTERVRKLVLSGNPLVQLSMRVMFWVVGRLPFMKRRILQGMTSL